MPRKDRQAKARLDTPLSPELHHFLMVGTGGSPARLPGWVALWETNPERGDSTHSSQLRGRSTATI